MPSGLYFLQHLWFFFWFCSSDLIRFLEEMRWSLENFPSNVYFLLTKSVTLLTVQDCEVGCHSIGHACSQMVPNLLGEVAKRYALSEKAIWQPLVSHSRWQNFWWWEMKMWLEGLMVWWTPEWLIGWELLDSWSDVTHWFSHMMLLESP